MNLLSEKPRQLLAISSTARSAVVFVPSFVFASINQFDVAVRGLDPFGYMDLASDHRHLRDCRGRNVAEASGLEVFKRLDDLRLRAHHERSVLKCRLPQRHTTDDQHLQVR